MPPRAGPLARTQGGHGAERPPQPAAHEVGELDPGHPRRLAGAAPHPEHAGQGQVVGVVTGAVAPRPVLPVAGDRDQHEARVARAQYVPAEAEARHHPRPEALDDDVVRVAEPEEDVTPRGLLEIEDQAALVAVDRAEERAQVPA